MGIASISIKHKPKDQDVTIEITNAVDWSLKRALNAKSSMVDINLKNDWRKYVSSVGEFEFKEDDTIEIYAAMDAAIDTNTDLLMSTTIQQVSTVLSGTRRLLKLRCVDRTALLLNMLIAFSFTQETSPNIIKKIIKAFVNENEGIGTVIDADTSVEATRTDSSAFPAQDLSLVWKSAYEWIQEVSQVEFMNTAAELRAGPVETRNYIFWVDKDNVLHWTSPLQTGSTDIIEGAAGVYQISLNKSVFDVINMIIYNGGDDKTGHGIYYYQYNNDTTNADLRMRFVAMIDISREYKEELFQLDALTAESTLNGAIDSDDTTISLTDASSFPATGFAEMNGEVIEYTGKTSNDLTGARRGVFSSSASSHADDDRVRLADSYGDLSNSNYRTEVKRRSGIRAQNVLKGVAGLRWKGNIMLRGNVTFAIGDLINVISQSTGLGDGQLVRVIDIQYIFNSKGLVTNLQIEEDMKAIEAQGTT